ncbi:cold shock domain-containing protein [Thalassobaculum salexigens]|uniref:cold shock domain-containing protein n=1 Tax=Thalassobaculum salexigens TaxID=455360 RepID=UPI00040F9493|nr:cold shock domain-containing protein [Thalassobaculum salexigens]
MEFIDFTSLNIGFTNAENYRARSNKELLSKYFVRDEYLERLLNPNVFFLIGEKGTGKTAYSTYMRNSRYKEKNAFTYDIRQTEYQKFLELKKSGYLPLSHYSEVWRTLLMILCASSIIDVSSTPKFLQRFSKLRGIKDAMDEFYRNAFSPEVSKVMTFIESSELSSELVAKYGGSGAKTSGKISGKVEDKKTTFQTNLLTLRRSFEDAVSQLNLDEDFILFIDGIDIRPSEIAYEEYFDCVRGLIDAVWSINTDFLSNIRDSRGRIRVVLLVRPDILLTSGLHNVNTKIRDNSVYLDWQTTYKDYRTSRLFSVADRILSSQQSNESDEIRKGTAWDHYFPFQSDNIEYQDDGLKESVSSFLSFLRFCYHRPRDVNAMMDTMQKILTARGGSKTVSRSDFNDPTFRDAHANYLLGEVRDQLLFYYTQSDYDQFISFFSYLNGKKKFSYEEYYSAFTRFCADCAASGKALPKFFDTAEVFLQFLYDHNVICYFETDDEGYEKKFIRWCFRERSPANPSPKVRANTDYEIFYGLTKALNVGRKVKLQPRVSAREIGSIVKFDANKKFGFIRGGASQKDYFFHISDFQKGMLIRIGDKVSYDPVMRDGKWRAGSVKVEK